MGKVVRLPVQRQRQKRLQCSSCGASGEGTCDCGAPYLPAGERAAEAVAREPDKSDRAIAETIGVSDKTVAKARRATADNSAVAKRTGKDGKARKTPTKRKSSLVVVGGEPVSPAKARQVALANARLATLSVREQVDVFIHELTNFEDDFAVQLLAWNEAHPILTTEARHALVLFLSNFSMRMQLLAQAIDGR